MSERLLLDNAKKQANRLAALAGIGAVGLLAGCGHGGEGIKSKQIASDEAAKAYGAAYQKASPAGKFVLQFLRTSEVDILDHNDSQDGNVYHRFTYNNACLQKTAYDIAGGSIKGSFNGIFSSGYVKGDVPTAAAYAYVDSDKPNELLIQSGHSDSLDLHFSGVNDGSDYLTPVDKQTRDVLATYGCDPGLTVHYEHPQGYGNGRTSSYIPRIFENIRPK